MNLTEVNLIEVNLIEVNLTMPFNQCDSIDIIQQMLRDIAEYQ